MEFSFTPDQEDLRRHIKELLDEVCPPEYAKRCDDEAQPPREAFDALAKHGWFGLILPAEYGGTGGSAIDLAIVLEEIGYHYEELSMWYFRTLCYGGYAIMQQGSKEQKDTLLPKILRGEICEVEIDPGTCAPRLTRYASVDDVGRCINPLIVDGQTHGAIVQGIGQALWEQCVVEPQTGQPLCGSFMDYGMPRSDRVPSMTTRIVEVLSPTNPLGIKAGGEGGTTAAPAVIVSAIVDALAPYGIDDIAMPVTPDRIWYAIQNGRRSKTSSNPHELY
jgi:hypothetical protein